MVLLDEFPNSVAVERQDGTDAASLSSSLVPSRRFLPGPGVVAAWVACLDAEMAGHTDGARTSGQGQNVFVIGR